MKKIIQGVVMSLAAAQMFAGFAASEPFDGVAAVVNKKIIPRSRVEHTEKDFIKQGRFTLTDDEKLRQEKALTFLIENELIIQSAEKAGIMVTNDEMDAALNNVKKRNNFMTDNELKAALNQEGIAWDDYLNELRTQIKIARLMNQEIRSKVVVSDDEIAEHFQKNRNAFKAAPPQVHIRQIFFAVKPDAPEADVEAVKNKAAAFVAELRGGADFSALAKERSEHASAANGGELGTFKHGELTPPFDAAFAMNAGDISDPLRSDSGFHILFVDRKTGGDDATFESAKAEIRRTLFEQKADALYKKWVAELKEQAYIEMR